MNCFDSKDSLFPVLYSFVFVLAVFLYTWHYTTGVQKDVCVMAREDEVENEQEVAQPTEADATEATVDEE